MQRYMIASNYILLYSYMMYSEKTELRRAANWYGVKAGSRDILLEQLQSIYIIY